jgi:glucose-1-phosphate thymidylyltransferase
MKGVILAAGLGSRLFPLTSVMSKQLLPVYDKPLIYYPISTLMLAGVKEILIITTPDDQPMFKKLLGRGEKFGIRIYYQEQIKPSGIAHGILLAEEFIKKSSFAYILGDNLFYGQGLGRELKKFQNPKGSHIFGYKVSNPSDYGVITINSNGEITELEEKPRHPKSDIAITGLYFYNNDALRIAKTLKPSSRGELEITDLNKVYLQDRQLTCTVMPRGTVWFDTGTFNRLHDAASFVRITEERTGLRIGDPSDVARVQKWIN